jgi:hypothetical protein
MPVGTACPVMDSVAQAHKAMTKVISNKLGNFINYLPETRK